MGLKGFFFIGIFGICSLWAFSEPFAGIVAYVIYYHTSPENTWWGSGLAAAGVRYSVVITLCLTIGTVLNLKKLPSGPRFLNKQEMLYVSLLGWMLILRMIYPMQRASFQGVALQMTDPVDKLFKIAPFLFALTHVVVTPRKFKQFMWLMVFCSLYLGYECLTTPASHYFKGRLEGVGASDARDSNMLAGHLVAMLPLLGVRFVLARWPGKLLCLGTGALVANGVVLTRSRSAFVAMIVGAVVGFVLLPKGRRRHLLPLIVLGAVGLTILVDDGYSKRMNSLEASEREKDESAQSRIRFWKAGFQMALDRPMGVGPGNFFSRIGDYLPQDAGRDPHNSFVRCVAELGWIGFGLYLAIIGNAFYVLWRTRRSAALRPELADYSWESFGVQISIISYFTSGLFGTYTYLELPWWLLMLPSSIERVLANAITGAKISDPNS